MNGAIIQRLMTVTQFLDWAPEGEKWELVAGFPVEMMAESDLHGTVKSNIHAALSRRLRPPSPCRPIVDSVMVVIDDYTSYRPDGLVNCARFLDPSTQIAEAPTVVF